MLQKYKVSGVSVPRCRFASDGIFDRFQQKIEITNTKWFDKPFDRLTVLSKVEGLTTLR